MGAELPDETADVELPLRMHRLAMVPGHVQGGAASFILDTGRPGHFDQHRHGKRPRARRDAEHSAQGVRRVGLGSRRVPHARRQPGLQSKIEYKNLSVVVLNLRAPSVLLGFRLGGIVGYKFLSRYRVAINLDKSIVQLQTRTAAKRDELAN